MYNTDFPDRADLPSNEKLVGSTIIAGVTALAILVTIVMPSEYGVDFTGVGRMLGLTEMGQIKMQLAEEAAANERLSAQVAAGTAPIVTAPVSVPSAELATLSARITAIEQVLVPAQPAPARLPDPVAAAPVAAAPVQPVATPRPVEVAAAPAGPQWRDEVSFTLTPMQGTEYKMVMEAGAVASYEFVVDGGTINFDAHGEGNGQSVTYEEGRGVPGDSGQIQPPFSGTHGWFFRNRGNTDVVVTLRTGGNYSELRKLI